MPVDHAGALPVPVVASDTGPPLLDLGALDDLDAHQHDGRDQQVIVVVS